MASRVAFLAADQSAGLSSASGGMRQFIRSASDIVARGRGCGGGRRLLVNHDHAPARAAAATSPVAIQTATLAAFTLVNSVVTTSVPDSTSSTPMMTEDRTFSQRG